MKDEKARWERGFAFIAAAKETLRAALACWLSRPFLRTGSVIRGDEPRTNPVGTGAVDYDEIVARREPRLFGRKVASSPNASRHE